MLSRRVLSITLVIAAGSSGLAAVLPAQAEGGSRGRPTHFAMTAAADVGRVLQFQTQPPPTSGAVGARVVCANRTGQRDEAAAADVDMLGVSIHDARSVAWTSRTGGKTVSSSRATIGSVDIVDPSIGTVTLSGIVSLSQAWHGRHGFHQSSHPTLASIVLHPRSGDDVTYPVPEPGHSVTIEDTIRVGVGRVEGGRTEHSAWAQVDAVTIRPLSGAFRKFKLAHSQARLQGGVGEQIYGGIALPGLGHDASGLLDSARDSVETVPCVGSGGGLSGGTGIASTLSDTVTARRVGAYQRSGLDSGGRPRVVVISEIRKVTIDGGIEIWGIHGRAASSRSRDGYVLSRHGSVVRRVLFNGERVRLLGRDSVKVGDIAVLEPLVVKKSKGSIEVTALRVTMLDGSGQVFDLGFARATLRPSGLSLRRGS
jgi:hypothetical protein